MGIFRRKNDEAFKIQLEKEAMEQMNNPYDSFLLPLDADMGDSDWSIKGKARAPHTITADELNGKAAPKSTSAPAVPTVTEAETTGIPMSPKTEEKAPADFLYKKMMESRNNATAQATDTPKSNKPEVQEQPQPSKPAHSEEPIDIDSVIRSLKEKVAPASPEFEAPSPKAEGNQTESFKSDAPPPSKPEATPAPSPTRNDATPDYNPTASAEERRTSLLARCNAYLEDEEFGVAKADTERYKLESVESILADFESRAAQKASKRFTPSASAAYPTSPVRESAAPKDMETTTAPLSDKAFTPTAEAPAPVIESGQPATADEGTDTAEVKHIFMAPTPKEPAPTSFTDIFSTRVIPDIKSSSVKQESDISPQLEGKTGVFNLPEGAVTGTRVDEEQPVAAEEEPLEAAIDDYKTVADRDRVAGELNSSRKRLTIRAFLNLLLLVPAVLLLTPLADSITASGMMGVYVAELILCFASAAVNFNVIQGVASLFNGQKDPDLPAALAVIAATIFAVVNAFCNGGMFGFSAAVIFSLLINTLAKRSFYSTALKNLSIIANNDAIKAISIVKSKKVTSTIVGNSIDGGALICCGAKATNVNGFLKYTYCAEPTAGKVKKLALIGIIFGIAFGLASLILSSKGVAFAFFVFAGTITLTAAPASALLSVLPLRSAATRLHGYDAMLTGYRAADELDLCNGITVNCKELFPEGTIRLVDMKLLSPNPFDQSILDAAAIAEEIGSPIAGIFKQVNTASDYNAKKPEVDSVIYEEKMGISGWVNDRRVFVGNRILMEAHGFAGLPPVELDKKIMRKGYFPVYLASDDIPCALLVVKYTTDSEVEYELRRLCNTGTTVLVNNCDPNISADMLCDYFGVYEETIAVMSKNGADLHNTITEHKESRSAGAVYKNNAAGMLAVMTAAINVKKSITAMTVIYLIGVALGIFTSAVCLFTSLIGIIAPLPIFIYQLTATVITCLPPLLRRP